MILAYRFSISVSETTPLKRPDIEAPGSAAAETEGVVERCISGGCACGVVEVGPGMCETAGWESVMGGAGWIGGWALRDEVEGWGCKAGVVGKEFVGEGDGGVVIHILRDIG